MYDYDNACIQPIFLVQVNLWLMLFCDNTQASTFHDLLEFIYTANVKFTSGNVQPLFEAATRMQVEVCNTRSQWSNTHVQHYFSLLGQKTKKHVFYLTMCIYIQRLTLINLIHGQIMFIMLTQYLCARLMCGLNIMELTVTSIICAHSYLLNVLLFNI